MFSLFGNMLNKKGEMSFYMYENMEKLKGNRKLLEI